VTGWGLEIPVRRLLSLHPAARMQSLTSPRRDAFVSFGWKQCFDNLSNLDSRNRMCALERASGPTREPWHAADFHASGQSSLRRHAVRSRVRSRTTNGSSG